MATRREGAAELRETVVVDGALCGLEEPVVDERTDREALEIVAQTRFAAFAIDRRQRIRHWSPGAERLFGLPAIAVIGRACHEVLSARDFLGDPCAGVAWPALAATAAGVSPPPTLMELGASDASRRLTRVSFLALPGPGPAFRLLVHLLDARRDRRLERLVSEIRSALAPSARLLHDTIPEPNPLSPREREILQLLSEGFATLNIAMRLNLSYATTRNHVANILRKTGAHHQSEALSLAFRKGWLS